MPALKAVAFDVIETLFPLDPLRPRLARIGLSEGDLETFFASLLRDAFALDTCGHYVPFREIASSVLGQMGVAEGDRQVLFEGFSELVASEDVRPAFERLRADSVGVVCLTNGDPDATRANLDRNGLSDLVDRTISIEEIGCWKPRERVYTYAAEAAGVAPREMALVACHAWDCQGALSAGLKAGYVDRGKPYAEAMARPTATGSTLPGVIDALLALSPETSADRASQ